MVAADKATQPPELQSLLLIHGQSVLTEVESTRTSRAVLKDWAQSGPDDILEFIAEFQNCAIRARPSSGVEADRYLVQELMDFEDAEVAVIKGLLVNPDPRSRVSSHPTGNGSMKTLMSRPRQPWSRPGGIWPWTLTNRFGKQ